jgi:hypothetical protein
MICYDSEGVFQVSIWLQLQGVTVFHADESNTLTHDTTVVFAGEIPSPPPHWLAVLGNPYILIWVLTLLCWRSLSASRPHGDCTALLSY